MTPPTDLDEVTATIATLGSQLEQATKEIEDLRAQVKYLLGKMFGQRREKIDPNQLRLFDDGQAILEEVRELPAPKPKAKPKEGGHGRKVFSANLERETIKLDVPASERCCPDCGDEMCPMGVDVTERGHYVAPKIVVKRYERMKYGCRQGHAVAVASLPDGVIHKGKYEASVYAFVATAKYCDHLPLNRIEGMFKRLGLHLPRQTQWDLLACLDELLAQPILVECRRQILEEKHLQADETFIRVQREGEKGTSQGVLWAWRNVRGSPIEKVLVEFKSNRSARGPDEFLGNWSGTLLTDGYDGVNPISTRNEITRAGCWSHARRKFVDSLGSNKKLASAALRPIQRLFWIERAIRIRAERDGLSREDLVELRLAVRDRRSKRVLRDIYEVVFAIDEDPKVSKESHLAKAATYLINQRAPLLAHLSCGEIPIHNNDTERDLRHVVTGRKNWLIFGSERGGQVAGRLYSLVLSCKFAGVDPAAYIEDVLGRLSTTPMSRIEELTPWGWAAARAAELGPPVGA